VFARLRQLDRAGTTIGGVSGGPYLLARAGLLAGHCATVHWEHAQALRDEFPDLVLVPSLYVIDRQRLTCAGGTAALDMALALIASDCGQKLAWQVGEWFIRTEPRHADIGQRPGRARALATAPPALRRMLTQMEAHIEEPLGRAELARASGISLRQLERQCRQWLGTGIAEAYLQVRLERAAELLRSTNLPVSEVALACGFCTASHFSRRFRELFGVTPSSEAARMAV
jgi:transcriptional regulator GlxA family with amidase domain